jgi:sugar/nucleoside kinase (ribokinase family)
MSRESPLPRPGFACFGELLLRLSAPGNELLLQSGSLNVHIGGAEANVAVALARWGHKALMVSVVPDNPLGSACGGELRRHGVHTDNIHTGPGRMGLYFLTVGAGHRPSEVLYDRAESAFALSPAELVNWDAILPQVGWLHVSGVTPALGAATAAAALRAVRAARAHGCWVSFDCNYRAKLWQRWQGDARRVLREIVAEADLLFAEERGVALILGREFQSPGARALSGERGRGAGHVSTPVPGGDHGQDSEERGRSRSCRQADVALGNDHHADVLHGSDHRSHRQRRRLRRRAAARDPERQGQPVGPGLRARRRLPQAFDSWRFQSQQRRGRAQSAAGCRIHSKALKGHDALWSY